MKEFKMYADNDEYGHDYESKYEHSQKYNSDKESAYSRLCEDVRVPLNKHEHEEGHGHMHEHESGHGHEHSHGHVHEHEPGHGHEHRHGHVHGREHTHAHKHSHKQTKAVLNRLSRAIGHLEAVKQMVEDNRDCSEVLIQLAAVRSALNNTGKLILKDHLDHCIVDAVSEKDPVAMENFKKAIDLFVK